MTILQCINIIKRNNLSSKCGFCLSDEYGSIKKGDDLIRYFTDDFTPIYFYNTHYVEKHGHMPCWNPTVEELLSDDWIICDISTKEVSPMQQ